MNRNDNGGVVKVLIIIAIVCVIIGGIFISIRGCSQKVARDFGGEYVLNLPPGEKLVEITWKDNADLWYLTKPMTEDDVPETYKFRQDNVAGMLEGTVTIIESR